MSQFCSSASIISLVPSAQKHSSLRRYFRYLRERISLINGFRKLVISIILESEIDQLSAHKQFCIVVNVSLRQWQFSSTSGSGQIDKRKANEQDLIFERVIPNVESNVRGYESAYVVATLFFAISTNH